MSPLAARLAVLLRSYGWDPAAWQGDLQGISALETADPKAAVERFHEMKRAFAAQRRADLLHALSRFPFVRDAPPAGDTRGMGLKEIEREIRLAARSLAHARSAADAIEEAARLRERLSVRALPAATPLSEVPWDAVAPAAEAAEEQRRAVAREARLDERIADARRSAARLRHHRVEAPDLSSAAEPDPAAAEARLAPVEARLRALHGLEDAYESACAPLRAAEVRAFRASTRKALEREARDLLASGDLAGLAALRARAEALRVEAAKLSSEAARARRSGRAPPPPERRAGDMLDPYG